MTELAKGLDTKNAPHSVAAAKAAKKTERKTAKPKSKAKAKKPVKAKSKKTVTRSSAVADLCRELGIDPPLGRAKLRRRGLSAPYTDMAKIKAILTDKE